MNDWSSKQRNPQVHWRQQNNNKQRHHGFGIKPSSVPNHNINTNANNINNDSEKSNGVFTSSTLSNSKVPHDTDSEMIAATNNGPRCDKFTPDICVDDFEYPEQAIIDEIQKKRDVFELMYSEVKDNEPLVDGIPRDIEESYNYPILQAVGSSLSTSSINHRVAALSPAYSTSSTNHDPVVDGMDALIGAITPRSSSNINSNSSAISGSATSSSTSQQSPPTSGFICPSEVMYGKPKLAKNKKGHWKVIVNAGEFTQTVRLEKCLNPNKKCNYVSPSFESRCAQVHSYHRLLVFEKGRGFHIDTFRLPTGCSCHVTKKQSTASSSSSPSSLSASSMTRAFSATNSNGFTQTDSLSNSAEAAGGGSGTSGASGTAGASGNGSSMSAERVLHPSALNDHHNQRANLSQHPLNSAVAQTDINQINQLKHYSNYSSNDQPNHGQLLPGSRIRSSAPAHESSMLSQTLWSILSSSERNQQTTPTQSIVLDHLTHNPSLAANVSNSVLLQLLGHYK